MDVLGNLNGKKKEAESGEIQPDSGISVSQHGESYSHSNASTNTTSTRASRSTVLRKSETGVDGKCKIYMVDPFTRRVDVTQSVCHFPGSRSRSGIGNSNFLTTTDKLDTQPYSRSLPPKRVKPTPTGSTCDPSNRTCSDELTCYIFKNIKENTEKVKALCELCYQYNELNTIDRSKLFDNALYELILVYVFFENKETISTKAKNSNSTMKGLIEKLINCEIESWSQAKAIMMLSLLSHIGSPVSFQDFKSIERLKRKTQEELQTAMGKVSTTGLACSVNVLLVLPVLREIKELWRDSPKDKNQVPLVEDRPQLIFRK